MQKKETEIGELRLNLFGKYLNSKFIWTMEYPAWECKGNTSTPQSLICNQVKTMNIPGANQIKEVFLLRIESY